MRDDRHKWTPPHSSDEAIDLGQATIKRAKITRQTLVSGPQVLSQSQLNLVGWPDICSDQSYAVCLRRDRILNVNGPECREGWNAESNQAISDATATYAVFDLIGSGAFELLKRGAELSLKVPSRSALRRVFGLEIMLYRYGAMDQFRLHVPIGFQEALISNLKSVAADLSETL